MACWQWLGSSYTKIGDLGFVRGLPKIRGAILGGLYDKDCNILGSILGSPYFRKLAVRIKGWGFRVKGCKVKRLAFRCRVRHCNNRVFSYCNAHLSYIF